MNIYKIRNKKTGLFATGSGGFNQKGKIWKVVPGSHLARRPTAEYSSYREVVEYKDLEIVVYELAEKEVIDVNQYKIEQNEKKRKRIAADAIRSQKRSLAHKEQQQERIKAEIERLKAQLND